MAGLEGIGNYIKTLGAPLSNVIDSFTSMKIMRDVFFEVDEQASSIVKKFGQGRENVLAIKQSMTDAYQEVAKMGGTLDNIGDIQRDIAGTLNRNVILSSESYKEFYAMTQVTQQNLSTIITSFKDAGFSIYQSSEQMQKVVNTAQNLGVSVEKVSSMVLSNMDAINKYNFQGGVEGMAKMAAQASALRVDMKTTLGFADKVFNPEGAIETAAALQRLGVTQGQLLDPLRLMNLAQNDPAELQNQIVEMTKSFVKLGESGNFEIMKGAKRRFQEIGKAMGIPYNELTKMALGSAELEDKMKKIKFPDTEQMASKETRQLIANLAEKGAGGEYKIKVTDEEGKVKEKSITELTEKDVQLLKTPPKKMEELAVDQLSVLKSINASLDAMSKAPGLAFAGTVTGDQILNAQKEMYSKISATFTETFKVDELRGSFDKGLQGMFDSILEGNTLEGFNEAGTEIYNQLNEIAAKFRDEGSKNWKEFIEDENKLIRVIRTLGDQLYNLGTEGIESLNKKIKEIFATGKTEKEEGLPGGGSNKKESEPPQFVPKPEGKPGETPPPTPPVTPTPTTEKTPPPLVPKPNLEDFAFSPAPMQKVVFPDIPKLGTLQSLPQDTIEIRGGTRTNEDLGRGGETNVNFTLNINVSGNGVSKADIQNVMNDSSMIESLKKELQKITAPNGTISPTEQRKRNNKEKFR
jgi:hypothetical protein